MKKYKTFFLLVMALFLLTSCSGSFEKEKNETQIAVEEAFKEAPKEANHKNENIQYYLPFGFEIDDETSNNIILKNGSKRYILFYNHQENAKSQVVYDATLQQKDYDVNESFHRDGKFGFLLIKKLNDDLNELTVGIGGVKVTTEVNTSSLKNEAVTMMTIANAVRYDVPKGEDS